MSETPVYDLVVIGAGPAGYIGAIRGAQLGMKVACVEKDATLGGTCLNVGCIPSKAMLESSEHYHYAKTGLKQHGVLIEGEVGLDLGAMLSRKDKVVKQLTEGVAFLFKKNKIDSYKGTARFEAPGKLVVTQAEGEVRLEAKKVLIATGSAPATLPGLELDGERVVCSTEALSFSEVPEHLIVIGAGVIGLELGSVWRRLGAKVTVLEYLPKILGPMDAEVTRHAERALKRQKIALKLGVKVTGAEVKGDTVEVHYLDKKEKAQVISGDRLLVAVGRKPYTDSLGLEAIGLELNGRGQIPVGAHYETAVPGVYAVGDVIPGPMLAHKAEHEAVAAVERMNGVAGHVNYNAIPAVAYIDPEVAGVGKTEAQLKEAGVEYRKGTFLFTPNGRAKSMAATQGVAKILADAKTDEILGCHVVGARAGDLLQEVVVAMEFGGSAEDIARSSHAHPSLSEVIKEAALAVDGRVLNG